MASKTKIKEESNDTQALLLLDSVVHSFEGNINVKANISHNQRKMHSISSSIKLLFCTGNDKAAPETSVDIIKLIIDYAQIKFTVSSDSFYEESSVVCSKNDADEYNYIIGTYNRNEQWAFDPPISEFHGIANTIYFGVEALRTGNEGKTFSLVIDHINNDFSPSEASVRYDYDGQVRNKKIQKESWNEATYESEHIKYGINDLICAKVYLTNKTVEFFKNGNSAYRGPIPFLYPWYFAIWPHSNQLRLRIILNEDKLVYD
eukprot:197111_1